MIKESTGDKIFGIVNAVVLALIGLSMLYPFVYVLSASLSDSQAVITGKVVLLPKGLNLNAYKKVLEDTSIWIAYANTLYYTVFGTVISMFISIIGAYPLSKKRLVGRRVFNLFIMFTMWFNAGTIPIYLNLKDLSLLNTRFAILVAFAVSVFNVILLRNFFEAVPDSLEESAAIDGANDIYMLFKIYLPLSAPALATIALFYAVSRWNGYFWAMVILKDDNKIPLQVLLKKLVVDMTKTDMDMFDSAKNYGKETVSYATIVIAVVPIMLVYPYIQKYFVKGVMVGAVKG